jgi:hypothetical protein
MNVRFRFVSLRSVIGNLEVIKRISFLLSTASSVKCQVVCSLLPLPPPSGPLSTQQIKEVGADFPLSGGQQEAQLQQKSTVTFRFHDPLYQRSKLTASKQHWQTCLRGSLQSAHILYLCFIRFSE